VIAGRPKRNEKRAASARLKLRKSAAVSVDPERDTPELLAEYVPAFNPTFLGLYGDAQATAATAKEFKIIYQKQPGATPGTYTVDHSAGTYLYDPQGRLRVYESFSQGPDAFAHDIGELLKSSG